MDSRYSACLVHVSYLVSLPGETSSLILVILMVKLPQITNYGVPTSLEYIVWFGVLIFVVQCFFVRQIYYLCRPRVKWLVTVPIILLVLAHSGLGIDASAQEFVDPSASILAQIKFARVTPAFAMIALAEVLITVSLCILFYHGGSGAAFPSTKRLLNTLIIYAVNRCLLSSLVAIVDLLVTVEDQSTWSLGLSFVMAKLYANSLLASLNSREHLRSRAAASAEC
ncbi:hypothetical protein F5J12DRAFT_355444 [Pisolithus orientalis]|uniref:uncharacterized protein n=1 Tax=Pisolithus orientalis TaxID=936130 RepID=UPI0022253FED|nr:uncharacterized protein F5J12DRAFT_355444 [Pisolithus orientalis]KAI5996475.1 hypothetical protein F5J12DRAFT_355444 [Pisolithus orientalis]